MTVRVSTKPTGIGREGMDGMRGKARLWKWGDVVIAAATLVAAFTLWGGSALAGRGTDGHDLVALVRTADGAEFTRALPSDAAPADLPVVSGGHSYILRIEPGRIRVLEADCPDKVCVTTGWLSRPGQMAACVPGRLLVRVVQADDPDVDVVSQ